MTKRKVTIGKFSGFQREDFSTMSDYFDFSEEQLVRWRASIEKDKKIIEIDIREQLDRVRILLIEEFGGVPKIESFVEWFFKNKPFFKRGDEVPKITDGQLIEYTKHYILQFRQQCRIGKKIQTGEVIWLLSRIKLEGLTALLIENSFINSEQGKDFVAILLGEETSEKVNWFKETTLLIYFLDEMHKAKAATHVVTANKFIEDNFLKSGLLFKNLKQAKNNIKNNKKSMPQNSNIIDHIILTIKNTLPKSF